MSSKVILIALSNLSPFATQGPLFTNCNINFTNSQRTPSMRTCALLEVKKNLRWKVWILTSSINRKWVANEMKFNSFLVYKKWARTCKVDPIINAHLDVDIFSITHWGGPWDGRPCKNRAMVYKPRLQLTCLTRRFGLGHKDGILSFLAQYLRNTSLSKHSFFVELEEAFAHKWYKMI